MDTIHTVTIAIFANGCVLLLQRNPDEYPGHGDKWELIGGHIHMGEAPILAAIREAAEETGIIELPSMQLVDIWPWPVGDETAENWIYTTTLEQELPVQISHEHQAYRWTPIEEALQMSLACKHSAILNDIVSSKLV